MKICADQPDAIYYDVFLNGKSIWCLYADEEIGIIETYEFSDKEIIVGVFANRNLILNTNKEYKIIILKGKVEIKKRI